MTRSFLVAVDTLGGLLVTFAEAVRRSRLSVKVLTTNCGKFAQHPVGVVRETGEDRNFTESIFCENYYFSGTTALTSLSSCKSPLLGTLGKHTEAEPLC